MNSYQEGWELAEERAKIVEDYVDEHELFKTTDAFQHDFDKNMEALQEVWRIVQTRHATESDIAVADIRSVIEGLILEAAGKYADMVIRNRGFIKGVM